MATPPAAVAIPEGVEQSHPDAVRRVRELEAAAGTAPMELADAVFTLGVTLFDEGSYATARSLLEQALAMRERALGPDHLKIAESLHELGSLLHQLGELEEARRLYERAIAIRERSLGPDQLLVAETAANLGSLLVTAGELDAARPALARALAIREQALGPEHPLVAQVLASLGGLEYAAGNLFEARRQFRRVVAIQERSLGPDDTGLTLGLNNLAAAEAGVGELASARTLLGRSLKLQQAALGADHPDLADTFSILGAVAFQQGDLAAARPFMERALVLDEKAYGTDDPRVATDLNNLGLLLATQGDPDSARPLYERALAIKRAARGADNPQVAASLSNLALLLSGLGDLEGARALYEQALDITRSRLGPDHPDVASTMNNLALVLAQQGDRTGARELYEQTIQLRERILGDRHPQLANTLHNLGDLMLDSGELSAARKLHERAARIRQEALGSDHPLLASSWRSLGLLDWMQHGPRRAQRDFLRAGVIVDHHLEQVLPSLSLAEQRAYLQQQAPRQVSLLLSSGGERGSRLERSYSQVLRLKGLLVEALRRQTAVAKLGADPVFAPRVEALTALRREVAGWYHRAGTEPVGAWEARYRELTAHKEALERELAAALGGTPIEQALATLDLDRVRRALRPGEALVDLYLYQQYRDGHAGGGRYAAVVTGRRSGPVAIDLGAADEVDRAVRRFGLAVGDPAAARRQLGALAERLWSPVAAVLPRGTMRVWLSPDGELGRVPWQLLPTGLGEGAVPLLTQTSSPRELVSLRERPARDSGQPTVLVVGDVDFGGAPAAGERGDLFAPLPGTGEEVAAVARVASGEHLAVSVLTGGAATKASVLESLGRSTVVHLATHGFFSHAPASARSGVREGERTDSGRDGPTRNPLVESGLALAGANLGISSIPDSAALLTAEELVGLDLGGCRLVTLSACDTGRGEEVTGQGVMGLRAAVVAAGARSLVMSLWKVPDTATTQLMERFYRNLWVRRLPPAEALLAAQLDCRDDSSGELSDPLVWAGWVMAGEGW